MKKTELLKQIEILIENQNNKEWMNLKEGATYAGVSYGTFIKFRAMGLKIAEVEGIKRVSRKEINRFLNEHSF